MRAVEAKAKLHYSNHQTINTSESSHYVGLFVHGLVGACIAGSWRFFDLKAKLHVFWLKVAAGNVTKESERR